MEEIVQLPEGVTAEIKGSRVKIAGKLGELNKPFMEPKIKKELQGNQIKLKSKSESKKSKRMIKTYAAHIKNMIKGVTKGFEYHLKVVFTHFPMTVKVDGGKIRIDNFIGERSPRFAKVVPGAEIKVTKQDIVISGIDIDAVSQTAGNIERKCQIVGRDRRVFQDGIYITKKAK